MKVKNTTFEFDGPEITSEHMEWLKRRQQGIGGSDASVCLGVNKYKGKYSLFMDKVTEPIDETNEYMHWGNRLEGIIVEEFLIREGINTQCDRNVELVHASYDWCRANLDGIVKDDPEYGSFIIEAKNVSEYVKGQWGEDFIPDHIYAQCQHNMVVSAIPMCFCVALFGGHELKIYRMVRDDTYCDELFSAEKDFWFNCVVANKAPPVDAEDAKCIGDQFPDSNGEELPPDPQIDKFVGQIVDLDARIKELKDERETHVNECKLIIGDHESAAGFTYNAKWKSSKPPMRFNKKLMEADHPGLIAKYSAEGKPQRRFTIG